MNQTRTVAGHKLSELVYATLTDTDYIWALYIYIYTVSGEGSRGHGGKRIQTQVKQITGQRQDFEQARTHTGGTK